MMTFKYTCPDCNAEMHWIDDVSTCLNPDCKSKEKGHNMTLNDYQNDTDTAAVYPGVRRKNLTALTYVVMGLVGESGEIANKMKKILRDGDSDRKRIEIQEEVGDVLWYVARLCTELGVTLENVAKANLLKLADRTARGVIAGSGDHR